MTTSETSLAPLKLTDRIQSLDIMRGIVLCGILLMNINGMGLYGAYADPTVSGGSSGWDLYTWITNSMLFEGTMRGLFSLLFGVGMFILLNRLETKGAGINAANIYFRRLTWMLVFGLIHSYLLLWDGEILYNYALMGFLVFSFRNMPPRKLIFASLFLFAAGTLWSYGEYKNDQKLVEQVAMVKSYRSEAKPLTKALQEADAKWTKIQMERSPEAVKEYNAHMRGNYFHVVGFLAPLNTHYNQFFPYRYDLWDVLSMMLLGISFYKLGIISGSKSNRFYVFMALCGYGIGLTINYFEVKMILESNFSMISFSKTNISYQFGRVAVCVGHIAFIMLLCKAAIFQWMKKGLAAMGKMALTNYVMHSIFAMFIFTGAGFGLFGRLHRHELLYVVFSIWIFQFIISPIWLRYYQFGPLEWIWRTLSYQKVYPLRKTQKVKVKSVSLQEED